MAIGIDISFYTTTIYDDKVKKYIYEADFSKIPDAAFQFIIPRASGGGNVDPGFHRTMADIAVRPWYKSAYHFFDPRIGAKLQANIFANAVKKYTLEINPVLDMEADYGMPNKDIVAAITSTLEEIESLLGRPVLIYTGPWWFDSHMWTSFLGIKRWPKWCSDHDLWIANPYTAKPMLPKAFKTWVFWQYTWQATYPGLLGSADMNTFNGTDQQFYDKYGNIPPAPVPIPLKTGKVIVNNLNVRTGPGTTYMVTGQKNYGDIVTIYDTIVNGDLTWVKIYNSKDAELWCCSEYYGKTYITIT